MDAATTFESIGTLIVASNHLAGLGFASAASKLTEIADVLLDEALDAGADYEMEAEFSEITGQRPSKQFWRKVFRRKKSRRKLWLCCTKPEARRTRKGKRVWGAVCQYKMGGKIRNMYRIVGRDPTKRPRAIYMGGRLMRVCR